jgi:uncharacterized protein
LEILTVPVGDGVLIYRPLARLAFAGNRAMAGLARAMALDGQDAMGAECPPEARAFLESIGFLEPDPPPPAARDLDYRPVNVVLLLTNRCSLRCTYCYASAGEGAGHTMSPTLARAAIDCVLANARNLERPSFELTFHGGGEPVMAWETLTQAVLHARSRDLPARITAVSNGIWSDGQREWIVDHLDRVTISCDGASATQDRQRPFPSGQSSSQAVMRTLRGLDRVGYDYGIRMTALAPWRGRLAADVRFLCQETGCRSIQVEPAYNTGRGVYRPPSAAEGEDFVAGFLEAHEVARRAGRRLTYSGARPWLLTTSFCSAPYHSLVVNAAGELVTCYEVTDEGHPLAVACTFGRLEGSRAVVDEGRRRALLERLEARRRGCHDCLCYWHCAGDCHVKALYPGADATPGESTRCRVNRDITLELLLMRVAEAEDGVWRGGNGPGGDGR